MAENFLKRGKIRTMAGDIARLQGKKPVQLKPAKEEKRKKELEEKERLQRIETEEERKERLEADTEVKAETEAKEKKNKGLIIGFFGKSH